MRNSKNIPGKTTASDVHIDTLFDSRIEKILVADKAHSINMVIVLVVVWVLCEQSNRCRHFEKTVSQKFKTFIVFPHATLNMNLLVSMLLCIV